MRQKCLEMVERCLPLSQYEYHTIEQEIEEAPDWPPISRVASMNGTLPENHFKSSYSDTATTVLPNGASVEVVKPSVSVVEVDTGDYAPSCDDSQTKLV